MDERLFAVVMRSGATVTKIEDGSAQSILHFLSSIFASGALMRTGATGRGDRAPSSAALRHFDGRTGFLELGQEKGSPLN